jgi:hypothetical protein
MLSFIIGFFIAIIYLSFFEWTLHRYVMHRPFGIITYPFKHHAQIHHHIFNADKTYHLLHEKDKYTIPMAWWNGPVLITIATIPFLLVSLFTGAWLFFIGATIAGYSYYGTYEYIHWCMHLPKNRSVERSGLFFRLNGHHLLHHRYMHKNFNVVFPLADFCLGTLLLRSKVKFAQATGKSVPNVQPK